MCRLSLLATDCMLRASAGQCTRRNARCFSASSHLWLCLLSGMRPIVGGAGKARRTSMADRIPERIVAMAHTPTDFTDELRGVWHPADCIVQVIDDGTDAEAAVRALRAHGVPASDISPVHRYGVRPSRRRYPAADRAGQAPVGHREWVRRGHGAGSISGGGAGRALAGRRPCRADASGSDSRDDRLLAIADVMAAYRAHTTVYYGGRGPRRPLSPAAQTDFLGVRAAIR